MKNCAHNKEILIIGVVIYQIGRAFIVQDNYLNNIDGSDSTIRPIFTELTDT